NGELCAQMLRNVAHRGEVLHAAEIDPVPELGHAHPAFALRHADFGERLAEFSAAKAGERTASGRRRGIFERFGKHGHRAGYRPARPCGQWAAEKPGRAATCTPAPRDP